MPEAKTDVIEIGTVIPLGQIVEELIEKQYPVCHQVVDRWDQIPHYRELLFHQLSLGAVKLAGKVYGGFGIAGLNPEIKTLGKDAILVLVKKYKVTGNLDNTSAFGAKQQHMMIQQSAFRPEGFLLYQVLPDLANV
jgi:hypothetical protein